RDQGNTSAAHHGLEIRRERPGAQTPIRRSRSVTPWPAAPGRWSPPGSRRSCPRAAGKIDTLTIAEALDRHPHHRRSARRLTSVLAAEQTPAALAHMVDAIQAPSVSTGPARIAPARIAPARIAPSAYALRKFTMSVIVLSREICSDEMSLSYLA